MLITKCHNSQKHSQSHLTTLILYLLAQLYIIFQLCTALIKEQWDSRERQYINKGVYARGKPENKDSELLQWFTFEGDSPGALSAFTKSECKGSLIDLHS